MRKSSGKSADIKKAGRTTLKAKIPLYQVFGVVMLILAGFAGSTQLFKVIARSQERKMRASFESKAKERTYMLGEILEENLQTLNWLSSLYRTSEQLERSEFREFVEPYLRTHSEVRALQWIPLVSDSMRAVYEEAARKDGLADFNIVEKRNNGSVYPAAGREEYFPVYYVEPYKGNAAAMGFDLGSNPEVYETLKWSYKHNLRTATRYIPSEQNTNNQYNLLICKPVYHNNLSIDSVENRRENFRGFVALVLNIDSFLNKAIADFEPWNVNIHIYDITSPEEKYLLGEQLPYIRHNIGKASRHLDRGKAILQTTDLYYSTKMPIANRKWEVICTPGPFFVAKEITSIPLISMASGFGFTIILSLLVLIALKRIAERRYARHEKEQLEAQLRQTQKMEAIGTLAGGIAHDFNNILASLIGYIDLSLEDSADGTTLHDNMSQAMTCCNRARSLVRQILTFCRKDEAKLVPMQINTIVKEALSLLRSSLPATIEIKQNIDSSGVIAADQTHIHQVLLNLCTNAAHAMEEKGGVLEVSLADCNIDSDIVTVDGTLKPGSYVRLTVRDNGCGMSSEVQDRIFEPFFTTKEAGKGTGMGLSVVHGIIENHNGIITVNSKEGQGTVFEIFFPCVEKTEDAETENSQVVLGCGERILFVDDEKILTEMAVQMLQRLAYDAVGKTDSTEALEVFRSDPDSFDLVITDQTMPNMSGTQLAQKLISIRPDIPIVLCTGFGGQINEDTAKAAGVNKILVKPLNKKEISIVIRQILEQKEANHEKYPCYR